MRFSRAMRVDSHVFVSATAAIWPDENVDADEFIAAAGIPTVLFGPGGEGAHATAEWVSLSDTEAVARTLTGVATRICA